MATTVIEHADEGRYVVEVDGETAGFTVYHLRGGNRYFFVHTEVMPPFAGTGVSRILVREALDDVKAKGGRVVPICPFVWAFIQNNPEYQEMVDHEIFNRIADKLHGS